MAKRKLLITRVIALADEKENVQIKGEIVTDELPIGANYEEVSIEGPKIRLFLDDDFDDEAYHMENWSPEEYLFEFDLFNKQE